jgi:DNA-binding XRE family transcriptional regulator
VEGIEERFGVVKVSVADVRVITARSHRIRSILGMPVARQPPVLRSRALEDGYIGDWRPIKGAAGKKLSQGDIEKRTGLLRCYISRVENGHTVPTVETLEKLARALEVPMYRLFYDGNEPPKLPNLTKAQVRGGHHLGRAGESN